MTQKLFLENRDTLTLDPENRIAVRGGHRHALTQQETALLTEMMKRSNAPVTRGELLCSAWGYIAPGTSRTVDVHVQHLRKKLGPGLIDTVYRTGYCLRALAG